MSALLLSRVSSFFRRLASLVSLLPRDWRFWTVAAVAAAVMGVMQFNVPLWYGGSDHGDYYWYGRFLLGQGFAGYALPPNWRTPGMGIFHILSGTVLFDTWKGFIALFALFSVAIPVLYYLIVRPHSRNLALVAALVVIASMTPTIYATMAGSDQVFFFLHALLLCLCVTYFHRRLDRRLTLPIVIAVVAACAHLVRPVGAVLFWIFVFVAVLLRPHDWRRLAAASGVYVALMAAWVVWDRDHGTNGGLGPGHGHELPNQLATIAERRLAQAYFSPQGLVHAQSDAAAKDYAASRTLRSELLARSSISTRRNGSRLRSSRRQACSAAMPAIPTAPGSFSMRCSPSATRSISPSLSQAPGRRSAMMPRSPCSTTWRESMGPRAGADWRAISSTSRRNCCSASCLISPGATCGPHSCAPSISPPTASTMSPTRCSPPNWGRPTRSFSHRAAIHRRTTRNIGHRKCWRGIRGNRRCSTAWWWEAMSGLTCFR